jgi:lysophospholipase L1-like esterase
MKRNQRCPSLAMMAGVLMILLAFIPCSAQEKADSAIALLKIGENEVNNSEHLHRFYEKLYSLKANSSGQVSIIHIGDSHIQADFLTEVVRKNLQREFGNAGRGLVVPARIAGTNEPLNFRTSSTTKWNAKRIIHSSKPLPIGIGGITVSTAEEGARFNLKMNDPLVDYSFNTVTLFYDEGLYSFNFSVQDSLFNELAIIIPREQQSAENFSRVILPASYSHVSFQAKKTNGQQEKATVFGLSLENGKPGVLYHSIGVNGAKYEHYNAANLFARQTKILHPDLILISLGTNESVEYPNINKNLLSQVSRLVNSISQNNPEAVFILITPPDAFLKKVKPNPGIETVRMQIIEYAVENGLAFWDMYKVNGGKSSAIEWKMRGLLRPDGIHFSRDGYAYQGNLLFEAIMKGYNEYVADRHP